MLKKILVSTLILLALTSVASAQTNQQIEIFHIEKDQVIKSIPTDSQIQQEVENFIKGITNIYKKFNPIPTKGYMVKVPLKPSIKVENQWINDLVDQVIIIFPENEKPYLLLFNDENTPIFLTFEGNMDAFLSKINFHPAQPD